MSTPKSLDERMSRAEVNIDNIEQHQKELTDAIKHLDKTINELRVDISGTELSSYQATQEIVSKAVSPQYDMIRAVKAEIAQLSVTIAENAPKLAESVKQDVLRSVTQWAVIIAFFVTLGGGTVAFLYSRLVDRIDANEKIIHEIDKRTTKNVNS